MHKFLVNADFVTCYDNDVEAFNVQHWTMEALAVLVENMVAANLVNRDYEPDFARKGQIVHTRRPANFDARRKGNADDVTVQDAEATDIPIALNQHIHTSFMLRDGEETIGMANMLETFLRPAAISLARQIDLTVLGQSYQFLENSAGVLGGLTGGSSGNGVDYITATRKVLVQNKSPLDRLHLVMGPEATTKMLQNPTFHQADRLGDQGGSMRDASLGKKFGLWTYECQNSPEIAVDASLGSGAVNNMAGYPAGTTVITVDAFGAGEVDPGQWIAINGIPYHVISTDNATATELTLEYGLREAVDNDDAIEVFDVGTVNLSGGYASGYDKEITIASVTPEVGQMITFGTQTHRYSVVRVPTSTTIELDRPLEAAITNSLPVNLGPAGGGVNFAFHKNALTLACRGLQLPRPGTGAVAGYAVFNGIPLRTVVTYLGLKQGHLVTMDLLAGVKVLDLNLGAVMFS